MMLFDTVTEFLQHYEKCYTMPIIGDWWHMDVVYFNRQTGEFELFDDQLDYQATVFPWVSCVATCHREAFPGLKSE